MSVKVSQSKGLEKLKQKVKGLKFRAVAGVLSGATNVETGEKVAKYAAFMEYGTESAPARPFLRQTSKAHEGEWKEQIATGIKHGGIENAEKVMGAVGRLMRANIVQTIRNGSFKALASSTVKSKRRKKRAEPASPLIDTTSLIKSIASEVRRT